MSERAATKRCSRSARIMHSARLLAGSRFTSIHIRSPLASEDAGQECRVNAGLPDQELAKHHVMGRGRDTSLPFEADAGAISPSYETTKNPYCTRLHMDVANLNSTHRLPLHILEILQILQMTPMVSDVTQLRTEKLESSVPLRMEHRWSRKMTIHLS